MRVHVVDPSAFTPPYDHALCAALARAGLDVELITSRFVYGPVPPARGYRVREDFYRRSAALGVGGRGRAALKLLEHAPGMARLARRTRRADVLHFQWLSVQPLDQFLLPRSRPRVLTAHDVLPREPRPGQLAATRRILHGMDAVVAHTEHGAARLREELDVPGDRIHVIPHGAFDYLTRLEDEAPLPAELASVRAPVILFFGLVRPYKGLDVLLEAFTSLSGAELWIVGMPRVPLEPLRALAARAAGTVRWVPRFITDREIPAFFRRADIVVLPYREIEGSGVLYTALAFGKALVLSRVGGFVEIGERHRAARLVPPGDPADLAAALQDLVDHPQRRDELGTAAARAAAGDYSWDHVAEKTRALYEDLLA